MAMTREEHAAITFDHLLTFVAQAELSHVRHDVDRLLDLLRDTRDRASRESPEFIAFLSAAVRFVEANQS